MAKQYRFREGDVVTQKITGFKVILLKRNWWIDQALHGEWEGKIWNKTGAHEGYWSNGNFFESELE